MKRLFSFVLLLAAIILQAQAAPMADDGKTFLENFYQKGWHISITIMTMTTTREKAWPHGCSISKAVGI